MDSDQISEWVRECIEDMSKRISEIIDRSFDKFQKELKADIMKLGEIRMKSEESENEGDTFVDDEVSLLYEKSEDGDSNEDLDSNEGEAELLGKINETAPNGFLIESYNLDPFSKLRGEVLGDNMAKSGSKTFDVYPIPVTELNDSSVSIKRRFGLNETQVFDKMLRQENEEQLHYIRGDDYFHCDYHDGIATLAFDPGRNRVGLQFEEKVQPAVRTWSKLLEGIECKLGAGQVDYLFDPGGGNLHFSILRDNQLTQVLHIFSFKSVKIVCGNFKLKDNSVCYFSENVLWALRTMNVVGSDSYGLSSSQKLRESVISRQRVCEATRDSREFDDVSRKSENGVVLQEKIRNRASYLLSEFGSGSHALQAADSIYILQHCDKAPDPLIMMETWNLLEGKDSESSSKCSFVTIEKHIVFVFLDLELYEEEKIIILKFKESLPVRFDLLSMDFEETLNDRTKGFYRSSYEQKGAIAEKRNENTKTMYYQESPILSSYLVVVVIGQFDYVKDHIPDGIVVRVYFQGGKAIQGEFALDVVVKTLGLYKEYFEVSYSLPKMDQVTLPDFVAGTMENYGLITFRGTMLLYSEKHYAAANKQRAANVDAHELAHQWSDQLVTTGWWIHLRLNEGFGTWVSYLSADSLFPDQKTWNKFPDESTEGFLLDGPVESHPIEVDINHACEIDEIFYAISYRKGAAVVQMLQSYLAPECFQQALASYNKKYSCSNAKIEDLRSVPEEESSEPVNKIMNTWTRQQGYHVISVRVKDRCLEFEQSRFSLSGSHSEEQWIVPITLCYDLYNARKGFLLQMKNETRGEENLRNKVLAKFIAYIYLITKRGMVKVQLNCLIRQPERPLPPPEPPPPYSTYKLPPFQDDNICFVRKLKLSIPIILTRMWDKWYFSECRVIDIVKGKLMSFYEVMIVAMVVGSLAGLIFFTYEVDVEGKGHFHAIDDRIRAFTVRR